MKLLSFMTAGDIRVGVLKNDRIVDLTQRSGGRIRALRALLGKAGLEEARALAERPETDIDLSAVRLMTPLPDAHRYFCVGLNYRAHVAETGRQANTNPSIFIRTPSSVVAHGEPIIRPLASDAFDFEEGSRW